jgi:hypothetical protein
MTGIRSINGETNTFFVIDSSNGKSSDVGIIRTKGRMPYDCISEVRHRRPKMEK